MGRLLIAFFVLFLFAGCNGKNHDNLVLKINTLSNSLDSLEKILLNNEIDTLAALRVATNAVEIRIKNYYNLVLDIYQNLMML